jgi:ABC-type sugar transport system ATPase subunit
MRQGRMVATYRAKDTNMEQLVAAMTGAFSREEAK